jgi:hypothetical protein
MGTSGNPAKRAAEEALRPSSAKDFKKKRGGIFELPSGLMMKLRNPGGMQALLAGGMMPNSLMGVVQKSLDKGQPAQAPDFLEQSEEGLPEGVDPKMVADMMAMMDNLMQKCAVEPKVYPVPEDESLRDDDLLYVDEIDDEDKMFVFQWVTGGTSDLETFRQRHTQRMDSLGQVAETGGNA